MGGGNCSFLAAPVLLKAFPPSLLLFFSFGLVVPFFFRAFWFILLRGLPHN